ncbi:hypothetical protein HID58_074561, partial [Brassica napus]
RRETEEDVSANLTSVLSEEKVRPENPSSRRKEVVDAKERSSIGNLNNFLSNFNDQVPNRLPTKFKSVSLLNYNIKCQNGWYYMSMAGTICLALAAAKKLNRSPTSLRCKPATNVLITMSPVYKKRMKTIGRVDVPQEAFKLEKEINAAKSAGRAVLSSRLVRFFVSLSGKGSFHVVPDFRKLCIEVTPTSNTAFLSEELCIGCVKFSDVKSQKSPFQAIQIINLPKDLEKDTIHCYNSNGFKLHRVPVPRPGKVLGLVGTNCILKSTALQILAGKIKPNLGRYNLYDITYTFCYILCRILLIGMKFGSLLWIRTSKFHPYCRRETKGMVESTLGMVLEKLDERGMMSEICDAMDLNHLLDREATQVSGGELQRFSIAAVCLKKPDIYIVLDYLSDFVCCLYGKPTAYGVVTLPFSVREGINVFLSGFVPSENLRFRDESLNFKVSDKPQESEGKVKSYAR